MRTTEATRYARWSAGIALLLAVVVACVYGARSWQSWQTIKKLPAAVPSTVEQRSAGFSFSKVVGDRTEFTVRASRATQFAQGGRSLLEDVWITAYGGSGERYDNLHTRTCDYLISSESTKCAGDVQIELDRPTDRHPETQPDVEGKDSRMVHVTTSHVSFDHKTGLATTDQPVHFQFAQGEGQGMGFRYQVQQGNMQLLHAVHLTLHQPEAPDHLPATEEPVLNLSGNSMIFDHDQRLIHLEGSVHAMQGNFDLTCGKLDVELDERMNARRLIATEYPALQSMGASRMKVTAETITALASSARIEAIIAEGRVHATAQNPTGDDELEAESVKTDLDAASNQPRQLVASGNVKVRSNRSGAMRNLETSLLHLDFDRRGKTHEVHLKHAVTPAGTMNVEDSIVLADGPTKQRVTLSAQHFEGEFGGNNELRTLRGSEGIRFKREIGANTTETSTSKDMVAEFDPAGTWSTIDQRGNVQLRRDDQLARAERAHFERNTDTTALEGSVVIIDPASRTTARSAIFKQTTGEFHATGRVATVESSSGGSQFVNFAPGPGRVSGDRLDANSSTGHAIYSGNARVWQGDAMVQGQTIELDRHTHTLTSTGEVRAVFPQAPVGRNGSAVGKSAKPEFWHAEGRRLTYQSDANWGRMEGKVRARSDEGAMSADRIDFFFEPKVNAPAEASDSTGEQQLTRASAVGNVKVEQQARRGIAEQAEYSASDGKFVLSGGSPTAYDGLGNQAEGRQLTFFFGDDSISVDSAEGLRTLTLHQVQK